MSHCYHRNIERDTRENQNFRLVVETGLHLQVVLMSLRPFESIGMEVHPGTDQFVHVEAGDGHAIVDGEKYPLRDGMAIIISAGAKHDVRAGSTGMKLYVVYSNQEHARGQVEMTKGVKGTATFRPTKYLRGLGA